MKIEDEYLVQYAFEPTNDMMKSLSLLYVPLIKQAFAVYHVLLAQKQAWNLSQSVSLRNLLNLLQIDLTTLEKHLLILQQYRLLRVFQKQTQTKNQMLFVLQKPLSFALFHQQADLLQQLKTEVGLAEYQYIRSLLENESISVHGYREITQQAVFEQATNQQEIPQIQPTNFSPFEHFTNGFDYERFLFNLSDMVFPNVLRTQQNLEQIGNIAMVYGLSVQEVRSILGMMDILGKQEFDMKEFSNRARKFSPIGKVVDDPYELSPSLFLKSKQNGTVINYYDGKILERLQSEYKLPIPVINVLIEHTLKTCQNRLPSNYIYKIASQWVRNQIATKQQALDVVNQTTPTKLKEDVAKNMRLTKRESKPVDQDALQRVLQWQKENQPEWKK